MSRVTVGRWGRNLAVRVPSGIVEEAGLTEGEQVEIESRDGDIVLRRPVARAHAKAAAEEIIAEGRKHPLGSAAISKLIDEGRRG